MNSILRFLRKLPLFIHRDRFSNELAEEMAFHREQREKELRDDGMSPEAARHAAMRQFGNPTRIKDQSQEIVGFRMESVAQDFRFALRQLRKNPGFTCTAVLMLALGICASVAIFAFVDAALIKPLPYSNPNRLVDVTESAAMLPRAFLSYPDYLDWKRLNKVFSSMDVYNSTDYLLATPTGAEPVHAARVTDGFFHTLGITPVLGRDFYAGEDLPSAPKAVMLSYATWQTRFAGRREIIGQTLTLSGVPNTIIGVLPQGFEFAPRGNAEFWATLHPSDPCALRRGCHNLVGIGRLKDGVPVQTALADMTSIAKQLERQYPDSNRGQSASVVPLSEAIVGDIRPVLLLLLAGAGMLLLIACVNVASLLLVRSENRRREIAVRGALGAAPARLVRQFVTEGVVLVALGTTLGLVTAYSAMQLLIKLIPKDMLAFAPYLQGLGLNPRVLAFAAATSLLAAALCSITPVMRLSLSDMRQGLTEAGRGSAGTVWRRFGANLAVLELTIAVVLLAGAGLLGKSLYRLLHVELNLQADHLATLDIAAPEAAYGKDEQAAALGRLVQSRIASLPGVKSVGITTSMPLSGNNNTTWIRILGKPYSGEHNEVNERSVSASYFETLQTKLWRGRYFNDSDQASSPRVAIINRTLARRYFPGENPIGRKIGDNTLTPKSIVEVVGIVDDIKEGALDSEIWPALYYPFNQSPDTYFSLLARTSQAEKMLLPEMTAAIHHVDLSIGTIDPSTMMDKIHDSPAAYLHRSAAWLVGGFAALALLLGVVGLYGVIAYSVSRRTREIGVRMALGAHRGSVYGLILKEAGWLIGFGIIAGLLCAVGAGTLMSKVLFGVRSWDVPTLIGVAGGLGLSALLASFIPARRAASVNPVEALRAE